jgi:hypothetical protein
MDTETDFLVLEGSPEAIAKLSELAKWIERDLHKLFRCHKAEFIGLRTCEAVRVWHDSKKVHKPEPIVSTAIVYES